MDDNSSDRLTLTRRFVEPSNAAHRQYEALRAFFVDGVPSAQAAAQFGYTPGSFRVLVHQFRNRPRREFFHAPSPEGRPIGKQTRLREQVIALRKQNLSVHDISRALATEGESLSSAAIAVILKQEGFAKLPRRADDDRPTRPRPFVAEAADVRQLDLSPRGFRTQGQRALWVILIIWDDLRAEPFFVYHSLCCFVCGDARRVNNGGNPSDRSGRGSTALCGVGGSSI